MVITVSDFIRSVVCSIVLLVVVVTTVTAEVAAKEAFYRHCTFDAERRAHLCDRLDSATGAPRLYGVIADSLGRPTVITRYFFGNLDSRQSWTIMRFRYEERTDGGTAVIRSFHNPSGLPTPIGYGFAEHILYGPDGRLQAITLLDHDGERPRRINAVTQALFNRTIPPGLNFGESTESAERRLMLQEWRYANNKQYSGREADPWDEQMAPLDEMAWFRLIELDKHGFVLHERPLSLAMKPVLFPDGVPVKTYDRDECGRPLAVHHRDSNGLAVRDRYGIARLVFSYDTLGRTSGWASFDEAGDPVAHPARNGAVRGELRYREFDGKLVEQIGFDTDGNPVVPKK